MCTGPSSSSLRLRLLCFYDASPTVIRTLSLHDALPISKTCTGHFLEALFVLWPTLCLRCSARGSFEGTRFGQKQDRKSTRLNSSHQIISYAVFCLKKTITRLPYSRSVVTQSSCILRSAA